MGRLLIACIVPAILGAQTTPPPRECTVTGVVTDARSAAPIPQATVTFRDQNLSQSTTTDGAGKFTWKTAQGPHTIMTVKDGYARTMNRVDCTGESANVKITLEPQSIISGRVTDEDGNPVAGAAVSLLRLAYMDFFKKLLPAGERVTDDNGDYRFETLPIGTFYLLAHAPPPAKKSDLVPIPTYYPGTIDPGSAAALHLRPGDNAGTDIRIAKAVAFSIRGTLAGEAGSGEIRSYAVRLLSPDPYALGAAPQAAIRDNKGHFEFHGVVPGSYILSATTLPPGVFEARTAITVADSDLDHIELTLAPGNHVAGMLVLADKDQTPPKMRVMLYSLEDTIGPPPTAECNGTSFAFEGVIPGFYRIVPARLTMQPVYFESLRVDGRDVPDWIADLATSSPHSIEITVGFDGGRVGGFARDAHGDPAPKTLVVLVPAGNGSLSAPQFAMTRSDDHGRYAFNAVQPGQYKIYAFENVSKPGAIRNRNVLLQFATLSTDVEVQPNATANADVNAIAASATASIE